MRKITFNEQTIAEIREYAKTHRFMETCNRFTLTPEVLRRISNEYDIRYTRRPKGKEIPQETIDLICDLYANTDMPIDKIRSQAGIRTSTVNDILKAHFSDEYMRQRKSHLYSLSKRGDKNPMLGKCGEDHPRYKGIVSDGKGYLMCLKPDWYTGRVGCTHVFVHTVVMCEALGLTELPKGYVVHHINNNPLDNSIDNLALMTNSAHSKIHTYQRSLRCKVQRSEDNRSESVPESISSETPDND